MIQLKDNVLCCDKNLASNLILETVKLMPKSERLSKKFSLRISASESRIFIQRNIKFKKYMW